MAVTSEVLNYVIGSRQITFGDRIIFLRPDPGSSKETEAWSLQVERNKLREESHKEYKE